MNNNTSYIPTSIRTSHIYIYIYHYSSYDSDYGKKTCAATLSRLEFNTSGDAGFVWL